MKKKYDYFVNDRKVSRKDFMSELRLCCQKVVHTDLVTEYIGVDLCAFDEKKFNSHMYDINKGIIVMMIGHNKTFRRKEVKA